MKQRLTAFFLLFAVFFALPLAVYADAGPKPSVQITFSSLPNEPCYATLLSERASTGPSSAWDGTMAHARYEEGEEEIWKAFVDYQDPDGFYFLQEIWDCTETGRLDWTYYPPNSFKILLYFPQSGQFWTSPIYERYAFDSYFTVDLTQVENGIFTAEKHYDFTWELISMAARMVLTLVVELAVALVFGYRNRHQLRIIFLVNVATQIGLNLLINLANWKSGAFAFILAYLGLELIVFAIEAVLYVYFLSPDKSKKRAVLYALVANVLSFWIGMRVSMWIPDIA
ncbi:hypothetical protein [uncultured Ruthenibacterium sp.]|uniref:hypothetical protein n=1 Tax=uncultured Ruthenibacterium sp. TaxID=1905347 RepID=UPI00349E52AB